MWTSKSSCGKNKPCDVGYLSDKSEICVAEVLIFLSHCLTSLLGESHWHIPVIKQLISSEFFSTVV